MGDIHSPDHTSKDGKATDQPVPIEQDQVFISLVREYYNTRRAANVEEARGSPDEPAFILAVADAVREGKITEEEIPMVLKHYRETGKLPEK